MTGLSAFWAMLVLGAAPALTTPDLPTGTVLFLQHSNPIVARWTKSDVTHVALAVRDEADTWIYEATPGQVRRVKLVQYLDEIARMNQRETRSIQVWTMAPHDDWRDRDRQALRDYLDQQVGRRYSIRNYLRRRTGDGIHCGELAASALAETGRFRFEPYFAQDPGRLIQQLRGHFSEPVQLALPELADEPSWSARTFARWTAFRHWCPWACYETWTFCW